MRKALVIVIVFVAACSPPNVERGETTKPVSSEPVTVPSVDLSIESTSVAEGEVGVVDRAGTKNEVTAAQRSAVEWSVVAARAAHSATTLPDGTILITGGCVIDGCGQASDHSFVVSRDGTMASAGPTLLAPRDAHTSTLLDDGRVVLIGGYPGEGMGVLDSIEVIDPASLTTIAQAPLIQGRGGHAATSMINGDVLVVGGWIASRRYTASTEVFDPATGQVRSATDAPYEADALDAITLEDGRVLIVGGQISPGQATAAAATFDPTTDTWTAVGELSTPRLKHFSVVLAYGRVLVLGGTSDDQNLLRTTELFDPTTNTFTPGPDMHEARYKFPGGAVLLGDGRVAIAGGGRTTEVLDIMSGTTTVVARSADRGSFATINLLASGDLLVLGGYDDHIRLRHEVLVVPAPER